MFVESSEVGPSTTVDPAIGLESVIENWRSKKQLAIFLQEFPFLLPRYCVNRDLKVFGSGKNQ